MESLLTFAQTASPLGVIALLVIVIIMLVKNSGVVDRLRGTQVLDKQKVTDKVSSDAIDTKLINEKLDRIMNNHLHSIPAMEATLGRVESKLGLVSEKVAKIEGVLKIDL